MSVRDGRPYEATVWLNESQTPDHAPQDDNSPLISEQQQMKKARRKAASAARQLQGDRQDWRSHLRPLPKGYRLVPEDTLTRTEKARRTRSIQKALERRKGRPSVTRDKRKFFRDPVREAQEYGVRLDPAGAAPWIDETVNREHYYPDERRAGPYPHEEELDRLCDWFLLNFAGDAERAFVERELAFKEEVLRPSERAAWVYMGEWPEAMAVRERLLTELKKKAGL